MPSQKSQTVLARNRPAVAHFNATVPTIDGAMIGVRHLGELVLSGQFEKQLDVLMQLWLVFLDGQQVIAALIDNLLGDLRLGADSIHRDNTVRQF